MEVVVSAAVLILVVLGVLAAVDSVSRTASANQGRTVAAALAEKDLERLRALRTSDLDKLAQIESDTQIVKVGEIDWKIVSKAQWVKDSTGEDISCALTGDKGSYLRITSSVTSATAPAGAKPVVMTSIVAPQPGKGTLTALVKGATGAPIVGLPVEAIGPTAGTEQTNDAGCAVFDESEAGSYTLRVNSTGWVDPDGNQQVDKSGTVSAGNLTTVEFLYDRAGSFPVSVKTIRPGIGLVDDRSNGVIAAHTGVSTGRRSMAVTGTGSSSFTFTSMFPFDTAYEVYSGECTTNNPATYTGLEDYFENNPDAVAKVDPGLIPGPTRIVIEPAIDVTVRYRATTNGVFNPVSGASVYAYPRTPDCAATTRVTLGTTGSDGRVPSNTAGGPGLPFGVYDLCVSYGSGTSRRRLNFSAVSNTNKDGTLFAADIRNTDPTGVSACPA